MRTGYELTYGDGTVTEAVPGHEGCDVEAKRMRRGDRNRYEQLRERAVGYRSFDELPPTGERVGWAAVLREAAGLLKEASPPAPLRPGEGREADDATAPRASRACHETAAGLERIAGVLEAGGRMVVVDPGALQESLDWLIERSIVSARLPALDGKQRLWAADDAQYRQGLLEHVPPALERLLVTTSMRANGLIGDEADREDEALGNSEASPTPGGEATTESSSE